MSASRLAVPGLSVVVEPTARFAWRHLTSGPVLFATGQFFAMAVSFVGSAVMVRAARPATVASYMLLLQAIMAVSLLMQLGLAPATLRFAPLARGTNGTSTTKVLRRRLLWLLIATWVVVAVPVALYWPSIAETLDAPELSGAAAVIGATGALLALNQVIDAYLRSFRRYFASVLLGELSPRLIMTVAFFVCLTIGKPMTWTSLALIFLSAQLATGVAYACALVLTTRDETSEPRRATPPPALTAIIGAAITMGVRAGISILLGASALWVLSWARPHEDVAAYSIMLSIIQLVGLTTSVAGRVVPQEFAVLHADGHLAELQRLVRGAATIVALLTLLTFVALILFGRGLIGLAYGGTYVRAWPALLILTTGVLVDAACGLSGFVLQSTGHHVALLRLTIAAALLNVVLSLALVQRFGMNGSALASTLSLIAFNAGMVFTARKRVGILTTAYLGQAGWSLTWRRVFRTPGHDSLGVHE
jgi:O-antigen/teichoic acid export membrane protein